jgi:glycosyltransferase involved in cell wall biosynthesis
MRIGISTSVIQRGKTGVGQYLIALLKAFRPYTKQHQWTLFVLEEDVPLLEFNRDCMQIVTVSEKHRAPIQNILWHQSRLPTLTREYGLDILHVPSYRRLLWQKPCPLVATIHDLAPFHVTGKYDWKRMFYGRVIARKLARRQDRIISISQNTSNDLTRFFGISPTKISLVHNGIDHERFFPGSQNEARAAVAQEFGLQGPFFLYVARLEHPAKNHLRLISAFEQFKVESRSNWRLVFGGSDWHGAETIHAAIKQSKFKSDIRALGFVPDTALPNLYRAAEVFVYPSLYEGFGLPPVEAMACNCPVICSTSGSLGEVVGTAAAIIEPEDESSISGKLLQLAAHEQERNRLRAAGLAQAKKFDWKHTAEGTLRVYESVKPAKPE